jgi:hypothetical protein
MFYLMRSASSSPDVITMIDGQTLPEELGVLHWVGGDHHSLLNSLVVLQ